MDWTRIKLSQTVSTNNFARTLTGQTNLVITADFQTDGRGQGTHTWESEAGKNLLMSIKVSPSEVLANEQFILSMAGALAIRAALKPFGKFTLKWANDIYLHDSKISGTLIETTLVGRKVQDCIFGIGINVNQCSFPDNIPNPVSLKQITGKPVDRERLLSDLLVCFEEYYDKVERGEYEAVRKEYNASLYRRGERHLYEDKDGQFEAEILHVNPNGHLVLLDCRSSLRTYELKQLRFIL